MTEVRLGLQIQKFLFGRVILWSGRSGHPNCRHLTSRGLMSRRSNFLSSWETIIWLQLMKLKWGESVQFVSQHYSGVIVLVTNGFTGSPTSNQDIC
jgi:hypothetical protein